MIKKKPTWTIIAKCFFNTRDEPVAYAECHDGPGTAVYYIFNKLYYYSWPDFEKAANGL